MNGQMAEKMMCTLEQINVGLNWVRADIYAVTEFMRTLERELAAVTAERDQARRERDALLEARAWRPIETAPKDKSSILIIDSENFITIGYFSEERGCFANTEECWKIETPTHWMPLPEPSMEAP